MLFYGLVAYSNKPSCEGFLMHSACCPSCHFDSLRFLMKTYENRNSRAPYAIVYVIFRQKARIKKMLNHDMIRKGCDSDFGGIPGVILPNGRIVYIPIPGDDFEEICYGDIHFGGDMGKLSALLGQVGPNMRFNGKGFPVSDKSKCHFDSDLDYNAYPRAEGWRGCFGQADAAQTVLRKASVVEPGY